MIFKWTDVQCGPGGSEPLVVWDSAVIYTIHFIYIVATVHNHCGHYAVTFARRWRALG